jgi:hypothetical protein
MGHHPPETPAPSSPDPLKSTKNQQKYGFDLTGYMTVDDYFSAEDLDTLNAAWSGRMENRDLRDISFGWGDPWTRLLNFEKVLSVLHTLLGRGFRVDHAFMINERFHGQAGRLHHQSHMVDQGIIYHCQKGRPFTTLLTISIALEEVPASGGGFCCVPGSHKANFDLPPEFFETLKHPHMVQLPQKKGSAILFSEALTHGTYPLGHESPRRSILIRLTPGGITYRQNPIETDITYSPPTHGRRDADLKPMRRELLDELQWKVAMRQPYFVDECGKARD